MVRGKFILVEIAQVNWSEAGRRLTFSAVYGTSPENKMFAKATPTGKVEIMVDNPEALEQFKIGEAYYLDFTPAPTK